MATAPAPVPQIPFGQGLLWRVAAPAGGPVGHLFGTIHLEDPRALELPAPVEQALAGASSFTTEVFMDRRASATFARASLLGGERDLRQLVGHELYIRMVPIALRSYGLPHAQLRRLKPWAAFTLLGRPRVVTGRTLDRVLEERARDLALPVHGLQPVEDLLRALDSLPLRHQIEILRDTVCRHAQLAEQTERLLAAYLARDLRAMLVLGAGPQEDPAAYEALLERLLYARNLEVLPALLRRLEPGGAFVALGASHLPGERGLLQLLSERGYAVSAIY